MTLDEWRHRALMESTETLHAFNHDREEAFAASDLAAAHHIFSVFLAEEPFDPRLSASEILQEFVATQESRSPSCLVEPDARFAGAPLRTGARRVLLKSMGVEEGVLDHIGFDFAEVSRVLTEVAEALTKTTQSPDLEARLQRKLETLATATTRDRTLPRTSMDASRRYAEDWRLSVGTTPWWFTFEDALEAELGELRRDPEPLERSGYAAGLRCLMGLWHPSDHVRTTTSFAEAGWMALRYRVLFQLRFEPSEREEQLMRQPANFSDGTPRLFVSAKRHAEGGLTVRLVDETCEHTTGCKCATDGLPEGVFPTFSFMSGDGPYEVSGIYLLLDRDISRYQTPTCDWIRNRRAA